MLKALIVDDEGIERRGIAMLIQKLMLPYETRDAANGADALELLRAQRFDVLLTDIRMPFMDGLQLAHEARRLYPELVIIIFSAYADFRNAQQAFRENVYRYLLKPVDVLEFKQVMADVARKIEKGREDSDRLTRLEREILSYKRGQTPPADGDRAAGADDEGGASPVTHAVSQVLRIIHEEYGERLGLSEVADRVYLNPSYLSTFFRREVGESFVRYLNNYRLDRAAEALRAGNRPVSEISRAVGFTGDSYFIMLFRDRFGCTPQQYRAASKE